MRIAVVTPYYKESIDTIARCHNSVRNQTIPADHFMVADGFPHKELDDWRLVHVKLPVNMNDYGDTPRLIGTSMAATLLYDAIALLDADCWFEPNHLELLVRKQQETNAQVVTCTRWLRRQDESILARCTESDGVRFNDTNCYLIMQDVFPIFRAWAFKDPSMGIIGDRLFWKAIQNNKLRLAHSDVPTVNYETTFACHYEWNNEEPPDNAKNIVYITDLGVYKMQGMEEYKRSMAAKRARMAKEAEEASQKVQSGEGEGQQ